jgi:hypothetical protein
MVGVTKSSTSRKDTFHSEPRQGALRLDQRSACFALPRFESATGGRNWPPPVMVSTAASYRELPVQCGFARPH